MIYTLEIDGKPVLSFQAATGEEARGVMKEEWLKSDLKAIKSGGRSLWDGKQKLTVRVAAPSEATRFDRDVKSLPSQDPGDLPIVYHVPLY
jgi:hypothetical protein